MTVYISGRRLATIMLAVGALGFCLGSGRAQQGTPDPTKLVMPSEPLVKPIATYAQWVIVYSYPEDSPKPTDGGDPPPPPPASFYLNPRKIVTTKAEGRIFEQTYDLKNQESDRWFLGGHDFAKIFGDPNWERMPETTFAPYGLPLPAIGFRNLNLVTEENFAGYLKNGDTVFLVFAPGGPKIGDVSLLKDPKAFAALDDVALIDANTRWPVLIREDGITQTYTYLEAPTGTLTLPADLQAMIDKENKARAILNAPSPRAF